MRIPAIAATLVAATLLFVVESTPAAACFGGWGFGGWGYGAAPAYGYYGSYGYAPRYYGAYGYAPRYYGGFGYRPRWGWRGYGYRGWRRW